MSAIGVGTFTLVATAKDVKGNYKTANASFTTYAAAPTLGITTPVNDSTVTSAPASATGTASNVIDVALLRFVTPRHRRQYDWLLGRQ